MPANSASRSTPKGVEFSDHLIVLGAASHPSHPRKPHKHRSFNLEEDDDSATPFHTSPSLPYRPAQKHRPRFFRHPPPLIPDHSLTPPRAFDEPVETSCTDSEEDHSPFPKLTPSPLPTPLDQTLERCTRINTKLNSLPSGGAFSLMNSSEDVDLSSSDDEQLASSRKIIRVQGSAKLSTASGLDDQTFDIDDDEFAIEGAEKVDEEEAVNVRSFGRSFARVCLKDDVDDDDPSQPPTLEKEKSQVAFDLPHHQVKPDNKSNSAQHPLTTDSPSVTSAASAHQRPDQQVITESHSAPPRRKSRLRLTFVRRQSIADSKEPKPEPTARAGTTPNMLDDSVSGVTRLSCFPMRRSPTKQQRIKFAEPAKANTGDTGIGNNGGGVGTTNQVVAMPDFDLQNRKSSRTRKNRKMVKNVSMQRDDWIDFATNAPQRQRSQWLARLISHNGADSEASSRGDSRGVQNESRRERRNSGWRLLRFWGRK